MSKVPVKRIAKIVISILFFAIVIGYGVARSRDVIFGIRLDIYDVANGESVTESVMDLKGIAKHASMVTVNGHTAKLGEDGTWKDTIAFLPGYNTISVIATDKFGKTVSKDIVVYYKAPPAPLVPEPDASAVTIPKISDTPTSGVQ